MGDIDFNKPDRTDPALDIIENIRNSFRELGKLLGDSTVINPLDGLIRLNPTSRRLEKYNATGGTWDEFLPKADDTQPYDMRAALANQADNATAADSATTAAACTGDCDGTASNALNLGGLPATDYRYISDVIDMAHGGHGGVTAAEGRNNMGLLWKEANGSDFPDKAAVRVNIGVRKSTGTETRASLPAGSAWTGSINVGFSATCVLISFGYESWVIDAWVQARDRASNAVQGKVGSTFTLSGSTLSWSWGPWDMESRNLSFDWAAIE